MGKIFNIMSFLSRKLPSPAAPLYIWNKSRVPGTGFLEENPPPNDIWGSYWSSDWTFGDGRILVTGPTLVYSDNLGATWNYVVPSDDFYLLKQIVYGNGKFVSISRNIGFDKNFLAYSSDGINWQKSMSGIFLDYGFDFPILQFSDGVFIVKLYDNGHLFSYDGINWQAAQNIPTASGFASNKSFSYGNGIFMRALQKGSENNIYTSTDAINWTLGSFGINTGRPVDIIYGNNKFIVFLSNQHSNTNGYTAVYSEDNGLTWNPCNISDGSISDSFRHLFYANGKFTVVYDYTLAEKVTTAAQSNDGINWTNSSIKRLYYSNGNYLSSNLSDGDIIYSSNFTNWTEINKPPSTSWNAITFGGGRFFSVGSGNRGIYSTDGINWTSFYLPLERNWNSVEYVGSRLFIFGEEPGSPGDPAFRGAYSDNMGFTWNTYLENPYPEKVVYVNGIFICTGGGLYSNNGINWQQMQGSIFPVGGGIAYGDGKYVNIGGGTNVIYSSDAINWSALNSMPPLSNGSWESIAFGNGIFVAAGSGTISGYGISQYNYNALAYSINGLNWTIVRISYNSIINRVLFKDNKFIAVSSYGSIVLYSYDGKRWIVSVKSNLPYIAQNGSALLAFGNNKFTLISNQVDSAYTT